ncbi:carbonic anhydrase [Micromonospora endolithica]|uniref:Carbonic anhydrase n=1 Tax=Micromonospora endolithica TaxID=230091 RepID=A0A3A9YYQ6_9ACTN|nr:carbonic anhydrase [Micromonospora endolithica]RKN41045.1 carbonic anhydrase [Micromonospora endolithica]TWJ24266.1 carbonic anhydrase [Micromonospora endolithica]
MDATGSRPQGWRISPSSALARLRAGHHRFRVGAPPATPAGAGPVAAVLSCADPQPEAATVFGGTDVYAVRTAGLEVGPASLGSLEYAVEHLGVPLVVVLGHATCSLPGGSGSDRVRAMLTALRRRSPMLDQAVRSGRCGLHGMIWHDTHRTLGEVRPLLPPPARRGGRLRPPTRTPTRPS